jgi:hypothetical protein
MKIWLEDGDVPFHGATAVNGFGRGPPPVQESQVLENKAWHQTFPLTLLDPACGNTEI